MFINFAIRDCAQVIAERFIEKYGIDPYKEACPCGSGIKFKFCCMKKPCAINNENELKSWQAKIDKDIWAQTDLAQPIRSVGIWVQLWVQIRLFGPWELGF